MLAVISLLLFFSTYAQNDVKSVNSIKYKPVKLNMKQGLIMNQMVINYALANSANELCKNHSKEFQNALRAFEPWALKMVDSSSKLQSGILSGNLMEFGDFTQCLGVYADSDYGIIRGKHCMITVQPNAEIVKKIVMIRGFSAKRFENAKEGFEGASLHWSVCVPDSCSHEDVLEHFNKTVLPLVEGIEVNIKLSKRDCFEVNDFTTFHKSDWTVIYIFSTIIGICLVCSFIDIVQRKKNVESNKLISIWSAYSNLLYIFAEQKGEDDLKCLHGIRFLSVAYVVAGHRFLITLFFPSVNSLDILDWLSYYSSTWITGGTVSVDTFFLLSGLLVSYNYFNYVSAGGRFSLPLFYFHRFVRLTPPLIAVILFLVTFTPHLGSGPLWKKITFATQKPCQYFWWSTILHIQNYLNGEFICILQTWYMTCEVQFFIFSPVILYPLHKWKFFGRINLIFFYIISLGLNFYFAWINKYKASSLVTNHLTTSEYFTKHYIVPYLRASPYIMGLGFGYFLHLKKDKKIKMNFLTSIIGWLISLSVLAIVLLGNYKFQLETYEYDHWGDSLFISCTRSAWTAGVIWLIWACRAGYGGIINSFLSSHFFQVMGKLTYGIFLTHLQYLHLTGGAAKLPIYFSNLDAIHKSLGDIVISSAMSFFLTIFVEYPFLRFSTSFLKKNKPKVKPVVVKPINSGNKSMKTSNI